MNIDELRKECQHEKLKTNTGLTLLNRKYSIFVTNLCVKAGISANQATVASLAIGLVGSVLFCFGEAWINLLAIVCLWFSLTLDQVDGELARYYKTVNLNGVYLDEIRHVLIYSVAVFCLSIAPAQQMDSMIPVCFGFLASMVLVVSRVEERLPYVMFGEKIVLKNNFTFGTLGDEHQNVTLSMKEGNEDLEEASNSLSKRLRLTVYALYEFMADQVGILFFMLFMTVGDFAIGYFGLQPGVSCQFVFVMFFSLLGGGLLSRTIYGHWQDSWGEERCRELQAKCRDFSP